MTPLKPHHALLCFGRQNELDTSNLWITFAGWVLGPQMFPFTYIHIHIVICGQHWNIYIYIYFVPSAEVFYAATNPLVVVSIQVAEGLHEIATFHILWHVPKSYLGHRRHGPTEIVVWFVDSKTWGSVFRQVFLDSWTLDQTHSIHVWYIYLYLPWKYIQINQM